MDGLDYGCGFPSVSVRHNKTQKPFSTGQRDISTAAKCVGERKSRKKVYGHELPPDG